VASAPLTSTKTFEIQDLSTPSCSLYAFLKRIGGIRQLNGFHVSAWVGVLNAGLQSLSIDLENVAILWVPQLNSTMWRYGNNCEQTIPSGAELTRKEPEFGVEKPYFLVRLKGLRPDVPVMKSLCLLLVNFGAVICIIPQLFQLCQLKLSVRADCLHIKVELLDCPTRPCAPVPQGGDMPFHRPTGMVTYQLAFCRLCGRPIVHH
jgi:hypothetical protein